MTMIQLVLQLVLLLHPVAALAPLSTWLQRGRGQSSSLVGRDSGAPPSPSHSGATRERAASSSSSSSTSTTAATATRTRALRVRRTVASDLPAVSRFLSTAAVAVSSDSSSTSNSSSQRSFWATQMDQLWARYDYESLLKRRLSAMEEGRQAKERLDAVFSSLVKTSLSSSELEQQQLYLEHLWWSSDRLRSEIAAAAHETGEDSVWRRRGTQLAPASLHWLNHVQLTATTTVPTKDGSMSEDQVVGFVEVAMLSNPCNVVDDEEKCRIALAPEEDDDHQPALHVYSPAITNLAVAPEYRRRGVGQRLMASAEAYVARTWGASTLGLYVQHDNVGANALYRARGYRSQVSLNDERLGRLWYRRKSLKPKPEKTTEEPKSQKSKHALVEEDSNNLVVSR